MCEIASSNKSLGPIIVSSESKGVIRLCNVLGYVMSFVVTICCAKIFTQSHFTTQININFINLHSIYVV
jgi:hypothetical protein